MQKTSAGAFSMRTMLAKDYTILSVGMNTNKGEIQLCPICGKNGVEVKIGGEVFYTHAITITEKAPGEIEFGDETCSSAKASGG